jgi:hypothetical protein
MNEYITGWWFGTWLLFFHNILGIIIPTDETHIFQRGWNHQPDKDSNDWGNHSTILI